MIRICTPTSVLDPSILLLKCREHLNLPILSSMFQVECDTNSEKIDKLQRPGSSKSSGKRPRVPNIDRPEGETLQEGKGAYLKGDKVVAPEPLAGEEEVMKDLAAAGLVPKVEVGEGWSVLEMGLYEKGLQIFGKNRYKTKNAALSAADRVIQLAREVSGFEKIQELPWFNPHD